MCVRKPRMIVLVLVILFVWETQAQQPAKCANNSELLGYKIRSINIDARFLNIPLPPKGSSYSEATRDDEGGQNKLLQEVRQSINLEQNRESIVGGTLNQINGKLSTIIDVKTITQCVEKVDEKVCQKEVGQNQCVDIRISAKSLRFNPNNPAESFLGSIPRSNSLTILSNVPKSLLILNPEFGVEYDKQFGLSQNLKFSTNLLDLSEHLRGDAVNVKSLRLDVKADGKKSTNNSFYKSRVEISFTKFLPSKFFEKASFSTKFNANKTPSGDSVFFQNGISFNGSLFLKPNLNLINNIVIEGGLAQEKNRFINNNASLTTKVNENNFNFRTLIDGKIKQDALRFSFWADGGKPKQSLFSYKRFAGLIGYAKGFGRGTQTLDLETLFGIGKVSGRIPNYAYFYGSNDLKNFIYEAYDSENIQRMPEGALIRSFGNGQTAKNNIGSNRYWHFNLNLSFPIKKWSRPLIPDESIELDDAIPNPTCPINTIRDLIKCQSGSGEVILAALYKKQGVTNYAEKAKKEFRSIKSAVNFLTDKANLYSIKPLFMFDAANFKSDMALNKTRFGIGAGLQITVVIAKFEAGYMRTMNPQIGDSQGNFVMRMYFQNLF